MRALAGGLLHAKLRRRTTASYTDGTAYRKVLLLVASTLLSYLLFEVAFYVALCFGLAAPVYPYYNYAAWTDPSFIAADPLIGIRLQANQPNDGIRVIQGDVQFYYHESANSAGFHSDHEYFPKRQKPYRIIVYGSSFVAMLYQSGSWVDHLNDILARDGIEVYNISFDGGALANWYAHYFRELTTTYEFDMVVFVMRPDDITDRFVVSETRSNGYFMNNFPEPPRDRDDLDRNYRPTLHRIVGMADPQFLADLNEHFTSHTFLAPPLDLYALKSVRLAIFGDRVTPVQLPAIDEAKGRVLFDSMLKDIRQRGKQSVIVTLPNRAFQTPDPEAEQLRAIAVGSCDAFIDGNELRGGRLCLDRFPPLISGTSAGWGRGLPFSGRQAGRA
jgi:hypothetical protein